MGVGVQGEAGFSVAQNSGQSLGVHPAGQGMGCECVSEIMKAEAWQPRLLQQSFQVIVGGIGADGLFWPEGIRKGPLGAGVFLSPGQQACGAGRQGDGPLFRACLGLAGNHPAALLDMERPVEGKGAVGFIKVAPHETAEFAPPQAGGQLRVEEIMSDFIRLNCLHEWF